MEITNSIKKDVYQEMADLEPKEGRYWQIDVLKVFAMLLVLMDHSTSHSKLRAIGSPFWERIAIPIFMIVLGFNWAKSLEKSKYLPYRKMFSWKNYWKNKIVHFLFPYSIIYVLSIILNYVMVPTEYLSIYGNELFRYILFPWVWGPGSWFIPTLFLTILVFPLVYMIFDKIPIVGLIFSFGVEVGWIFLLNKSLDTYLLSPTPTFDGFYFIFLSLICTPFILMSAIGMGVWLSQNQKLFSLRNILIWVLGLLSAIYIYVYTFTPAPIFYTMDWSHKIISIVNSLIVWTKGLDYNMFFFPYSALIVMIFLNILPRKPKGIFARFITLISKSTFHILMVQIFFFSILYNRFIPMFSPILGAPVIWASIFPTIEWVNLMFYPLHVVVTFGFGVLWYWLEKKVIWDKLKQRSDKKKH